MNLRLGRVAAIGLGLSVVGCGPLVTGDFDAAQVCKTLPNQAFQAAPFSMQATATASMPVDLTTELQPIEKQGVTVNVELTSLTLSPAQGVSDFGFVDALKLSAQLPTGDATLAQYAKDQSAPAPAELLLESQQPVNLVVQDGQVQVDLTATGQMPTSNWSVKAVACFHVSGTISR